MNVERYRVDQRFDDCNCRGKSEAASDGVTHRDGDGEVHDGETGCFSGCHDEGSLYDCSWKAFCVVDAKKSN